MRRRWRSLPLIWPSAMARRWGRARFWRQGTGRALMAGRECARAAAEAEMAGYEARGMSSQAFYAVLQAAIGDRWLVDKAISYTLDLKTLRRAEEDFTEARY